VIEFLNPIANRCKELHLTRMCPIQEGGGLRFQNDENQNPIIQEGDLQTIYLESFFTLVPTKFLT